jgi:hypothetical protein
VIAAALLFGCAAVPPSDGIPPGAAPAYTARALTAYPNQSAVLARYWAPGLDDGYVPQGLALLDGALFVSTYHSTDPHQDTGSCRVFQVDRGTGAALGHFDLPSNCGHAGGLASAGAGILYVADTSRIYAVDVARALREGEAAPAIRKTLALGGKVKGSFAAADGTSLWLGVYDVSPAQMFSFSLAALDGKADGAILTERDATRVLPVAAHAQGAAFDRAGRLWITRSNSRFGSLQQLDPADGSVVREYAMPTGIEDIAFDQEGRLWAVSEAGAQRWQHWAAFHPLVLRFDVNQLR